MGVDLMIYEKLMIVQEKLNAPKNQHNSFGNYNYRSCEDIIEAVKPILKEQKLSLTISDSIEYIGNRYYVKATALMLGKKNLRKEWIARRLQEAQVVMQENMH